MYMRDRETDRRRRKRTFEDEYGAEEGTKGKIEGMLLFVLFVAFLAGFL